ncbi:hypothetical protein A6V36_01875 [Paraburkholderia ginsengiterrae]|uniref:Uncharacterized protein n=1 Tax=Paraburkholderia ginsengiterrae TaxID=1462993 RepID=A0A1A9NBP0_9BURK|nr:hypothetical protein [Paraburkholderia ginsengiterrae]OAJ60567.1 hypothetical protein A6V36_01875 [Paraburkholderia ginsengiterrae]OAJ64121.1 hypothetical protein A6V37_01075 [Paraburkholderia ginsengiterrae]
MLAIESAFELVACGERHALNRSAADLLSGALKAVDREDHSAVTVQQHPLGFLCVKWNIDASRSLRIHVWGQDMRYRQEPNWPIHDHIFSFKSVILLGKVQNKIYTLSEQGKGRMCKIFEVDYTREQSTLIATGDPAMLTMTSATVYEEGQTYEMQSGILHRTALRSSFAVTVLATTLVRSQFGARPRVIGATGGFGLAYNRRIAQKQEVLEQLESARKSLLIF